LVAGAAVGGLAWGLGLATAELWVRLSRLTFWTVNGILERFTSDLICDPEKLVIGTSRFAVEIAPACSGYEGIGLILVFLGAYVWFFRTHLRFPHVLILFPLGVVLIWLANAVRIAALIGIGSAGWPEIAQGGFHSLAGWLTFNFLALGFVTLTTRYQFFRSSAAPTVTEGGANATAAYLGPWMAILTVAMITGIFSTVHEWFYPLHVLAAAAVIWVYRQIYGRWDGTVAWQAVALGAAGFGLWLVLAPAEHYEVTGPPGPLTDAGWSWAAGWLAFRLLGYLGTAPFAEELAFRGYLTRRLVQSDFQQLPLGGMSWISFAASSLLFGLMHGRCWLAGTLAGMLFAVALRLRGRLADAVLAHATTNALLAIYVLVTGRWLLWG
jgi:exosortase E/protease (VPEID-CTERM system)